MAGEPSFSGVNPYAAPQADLQPDLSQLAGVGCWRHGSLLLMHEDAHLPPLCVKTGRPAVGYRLSRVRWSHPLRWPREYVLFDVPLSARPIYWLGGGRRLLLGAAAATIVISAGAMVGVGFLMPNEDSSELQFAVATIGIFATFTMLVSWGVLAQPLWFVRRKGKYYWLSGANRRFLEQLPPWPYR